ncbi:hypothetical protein HPG69_015075 [Diceros bicornis minor]|uniref:PTB domain-containing protein n=1 Tax=Diceros bicornis minor TaxID=77932 RepID=A0A7J7FK99_DICBM|nr:hypothetical protein HPG69_015075 [Diceros bicornis minor]
MDQPRRDHLQSLVEGMLSPCPPWLCTPRIFGFVAKKPGSPWENVCHLFAELDPDQPAGAIVTFITKVLLGQRK